MIGPGGQSMKFTPEGGLAVLLVNKTGSASKKGNIVEASTTTRRGVALVPANEPDPIGVIYDDGVADGDLIWVVIIGMAEVLLEDGTSTTYDNWIRVSPTVAGRGDGSLAGPPGGTINEIDNHFKEIGHVFEDVNSGTNKLALCLVHFN